jgi:Ring finger domain
MESHEANTYQVNQNQNTNPFLDEPEEPKVNTLPMYIKGAGSKRNSLLGRYMQPEDLNQAAILYRQVDQNSLVIKLASETGSSVAGKDKKESSSGTSLHNEARSYDANRKSIAEIEVEFGQPNVKKQDGRQVFSDILSRNHHQSNPQSENLRVNKVFAHSQDLSVPAKVGFESKTELTSCNMPDSKSDQDYVPIQQEFQVEERPKRCVARAAEPTTHLASMPDGTACGLQVARAVIGPNVAAPPAQGVVQRPKLSGRSHQDIRILQVRGPKNSIIQSCSICYEDLDKKQFGSAFLDCGHWFHHDCLLPWFKKRHNNCPECKATVTQQSVVVSTE